MSLINRILDHLSAGHESNSVVKMLTGSLKDTGRIVPGINRSWSTGDEVHVNWPDASVDRGYALWLDAERNPGQITRPNLIIACRPEISRQTQKPLDKPAPSVR